MIQILRTSQMLSICWTIEVYSEKNNYINHEYRRDIFVFAFLISGFLTLCQRGGIHTQAQDSAGGSDTLLAMDSSKWCKSVWAHLQTQSQTYSLADSFWFVLFLENINTYTPTTKEVLFLKTFPSADF